jgi:hypothetical protein
MTTKTSPGAAREIFDDLVSHAQHLRCGVQLTADTFEAGDESFEYAGSFEQLAGWLAGPGSPMTVRTLPILEVIPTRLVESPAPSLVEEVHDRGGAFQPSGAVACSGHQPQEHRAGAAPTPEGSWRTSCC